MTNLMITGYDGEVRGNGVEDVVITVMVTEM